MPYSFSFRRLGIAAIGVALLASAAAACQTDTNSETENAAPLDATSAPASESSPTSAASPQTAAPDLTPTSTPEPYASNDGGTSAAQEMPTRAPRDSAALDAPLFPAVIPQDMPLEVPEGVPEELAIVWQVWSMLAAEHVDRGTFDPEVFTEASIRGMLMALDDPHTNYVRPDVFGMESEDIRGRFEGIGAHVSMNADGRLVVVAPIANSPAERAGIRPGDTILEVDGESIEGISLIEAVSKIRGPRGSIVRLLVQHIGDVERVVIEVERGVIPLQSVVMRSDPGARIAHIRLTNFYEDTADTLTETIRNTMAAGTEGIVLDLRDNPGGLLNSVVDVTSLFLEGGLLILYEVDGDGNRKDWIVRQNDDVLEQVPMVLLANQFSASASEILVGALQDHDRATVIGRKTFGKGSVSVLRQLDNGGGLFITFARWFTPDGRLIDRNGLEPDIEILHGDAQEEDIRQLERAIETLEAELEQSAPTALRPAA
ncbi:MAG: S41 family peptidase [Chloroflexota bacterium]|nr:S41 family peptidase [Chloroflexota bacterium]